MCMGVAECVHHLDPRIEWLERHYDNWKIRSFDVGSEQEGDLIRRIYVVGRGQPSSPEYLRGGPGHDQSMILLKNDLPFFVGQEDIDVSQEMVEHHYACWRCDALAEFPHVCAYDGCDKALPHMAGPFCVEHYWDSDCREGDLVRAAEALVEDEAQPFEGDRRYARSMGGLANAFTGVSLPPDIFMMNLHLDMNGDLS